MSADTALRTERVPLADLKPHPRNYRAHPEDQVEHLMQSLREHGQYRNIVIAKDGTILAGHGVVQAATALGWESIDAVRLDLAPESPRALKVLAADNTLSHLAEQDDRELSELLKELSQTDDAGLLGTGFDEGMLANLVFVTRPKSELGSLDAAAQWAGMPEYLPPSDDYRVAVRFRSAEDRAAFLALTGLKLEVDEKLGWWPPKEARDDLGSIRFEQGAA